MELSHSKKQKNCNTLLVLLYNYQDFGNSILKHCTTGWCMSISTRPRPTFPPPDREEASSCLNFVFFIVIIMVILSFFSRLFFLQMEAARC